MTNSQIYHHFVLMPELMSFDPSKNYKDLFKGVREEMVEKGYIVLESSIHVNDLPRSVVIGLETEQIFLLKVREDFFRSVKNRGLIFYFNEHFIRESTPENK